MRIYFEYRYKKQVPMVFSLMEEAFAHVQTSFMIRTLVMITRGCIYMAPGVTL